MKKIVCMIIVITVVFLNIYSAYAGEWVSVEEIKSDSEPLLERYGEYPSSGYVLNMNGKTYIVGRQFSEYTIPTEINTDNKELWSGQCYMLRYSGYDSVWSTRGIPVEPIKFYRDGNLVCEHTFNNNICAVGYFNKYYYCQLFGTWQVYKSSDMKTWEETDEIIPRQVDNLTYAGDKISFDNKKMISINRESDSQKRFYSTLGDWIVEVDDDYNFYLSNDNVYFVKIDMPYCEIEHKDLTDINHCPNLLHKQEIQAINLRCIYESGEDIIADIKTTPRVYYRRLRMPKQNIYDELNEQKVSPYIIYNNTVLAFEQPPVIKDGNTLVPIRFLFEQMGADVKWEQSTQTATISQNNTAISFDINNPVARVNGKSATMNIPAQLINGKTMVPVRFLSEELGYTVNWDGDKRIITIE